MKTRHVLSFVATAVLLVGATTGLLAQSHLVKAKAKDVKAKVEGTTVQTNTVSRTNLIARTNLLTKPKTGW
jgi:hypothetical protein